MWRRRQSSSRQWVRRWCRYVRGHSAQWMYWTILAFGGYVGVPYDPDCESTPNDDELTELERWWRLETRDRR